VILKNRRGKEMRNNDALLYDNEFLEFIRMNFWDDREKPFAFKEHYAKTITEKLASEKLNEGINLYKRIRQNTDNLLEFIEEYKKGYKKKHFFCLEPKKATFHVTERYDGVEQIIGFVKTIYIENEKFELPKAIPIDTAILIRMAGFDNNRFVTDEDLLKFEETLLTLNNGEKEL